MNTQFYIKLFIYIKMDLALNNQQRLIYNNGGAGGIMVIVVGNGHGDTSSNPGPG